MRVCALGLAVCLTILVGTAAPARAEGSSGTWTGEIRIDDARVYAGLGGPLLGTMPSGSPVQVQAWLPGPTLTSDNATWADIGDGRFVHSSVLRRAPVGAVPRPPQIVSAHHWADVNLTQQLLTLYDGPTPVRSTMMNAGRPGPDTATHSGVWPIFARVANETMVGADYYITNVLYTQYFTADGEAIHLNYWLNDDERGMPRSHGCVGLTYADASFAWEFLSLGSLVYVHD